MNSCRLSCIPRKSTLVTRGQHSTTAGVTPLSHLSCPCMSPSSSPAAELKGNKRQWRRFKPKHLFTAADSELHTKRGQFRARHHPAGLPLSSAQLRIWPNSCMLLVMCYHRFHSEDTTDALITTNIFVSNAQALHRVTKHFPPPHCHFHLAQQVLGSTKFWSTSKMHLLQREFRIE